MHQTLRESVAPSAGASYPAATIIACANAPVSVHPTASFTAAASAAAATPRAAPPPTSTAVLAPTVAPTASSTTVAPSTATASYTAAARTITAAPTPTAAALAPVASTMIAVTPALQPPALPSSESPVSVRSSRQSQQLLPQGTYLPPCSMAVAMGPWGQQFLHWNMLSQPVPHKRGEPTHFNAQNEPVNARGKPYVPPPPPGPRGCNGGSHKSWMKREKEKARRQQKRAATGQ